MKVQVKEKPKTFEPIEIKLTIESEEELCDLWHRTAVEPNVLLNTTLKGILKFNADLNSCDRLYRMIDMYVNDRKLKQ